MGSGNRKIVRAEFLHYRNLAKNSDKIYNIFLIQNGEDDDFDCISEHGRRGSSLVRVIVSANTVRAKAERDLQRKLTAKRNHRVTPYETNPAGSRDSRLAREIEFFTSTPSEVEMAESRDAKVGEPRTRAKPAGMLNSGQFDSLEL
ncbi:MAG: hypothetical protein AB7V18_15200 [Pyrinomonadaceae bacterium]